jgi:hypothetical protein
MQIAGPIHRTVPPWHQTVSRDRIKTFGFFSKGTYTTSLRVCLIMLHHCMHDGMLMCVKKTHTIYRGVAAYIHYYCIVTIFNITAYILLFILARNDTILVIHIMNTVPEVRNLI